MLGRGIRAGTALDFPAFPLDQIINKTRLRLDTISFYNIIRLLILDDYLLSQQSRIGPHISLAKTSVLYAMKVKGAR